MIKMNIILEEHGSDMRNMLMSIRETVDLNVWKFKVSLKAFA
jgi:hypothetical protein